MARAIIVGGGFSGAMLAARLAETGQEAVVVDRTGRFGLGVAYSTPFDGHLLNVRSGRMSAVKDRPADFVDWLKAAASEYGDPDGFAPRRLYGLYVQDRLAKVEAAHPGKIETVTGEVVAVEDGSVVLADGRRIEGDAVVLATGNPAPKTASGEGRVISDPWAPGALDQIGPEDGVIVVGTGLTMADMIVWLTARGWRGRATALSRRGLKPRSHAAKPDAPQAPTDRITSGPASLRLKAARALAREAGWREVMEGLRPMTARLWADADAPTRSSFVRRLRPWWDVHRHRIAPEIAGVLDDLEQTGRLAMVAGHVAGIAADAEGVRLDWKRRGQAGAPIIGRWLIDCSGPGHDAARDTLTGPLIAAGRARLDALRLGLELDAQGRVLDREGRANPRLFVLGPPARATFWETIAVPDIRERIEDVASALKG